MPLGGKTVLINGAAGVGHMAVQLAKWKGARVVAVASSRNEESLHDLGADEFSDYSKTAPQDVCRNVDLVLDAVDGPTTDRFLSTLKPGGTLFPIFSLGFDGTAEAEALGVTVSAVQVRSSGAQLGRAAPLLDDGTIRVAIDARFPLADAKLAHERAKRGRIQGKVVLDVA